MTRPTPAPRPAVTYHGTVVAPAQIALGVVAGVAAAAVLQAVDSGLWPFAVLAFVLAVAVAVYLAVVVVDIDGRTITIGQGRGERDPRLVYVAEVREYRLRDLSWPQCFGVGLHDDDRVTRLSVRAGDTLELTLHDGELIRVSVADAGAAIRALDAAAISG